MLTVTLVAVCLAAILATPILGIPFTVVAIGAWIRTVCVQVRLKALGAGITMSEKVSEFLLSLFIVCASWMVFVFTMFLSVVLVVLIYLLLGDAQPNTPVRVLVVMLTLLAFALSAAATIVVARTLHRQMGRY